MNLRLRLIVAFFFLSVVPLGAVTLYTYTSNAKALREVAGHEAELLAGELTQRMQLVTAQLSERVEHLMDLAAVTATPASASQPVTTPVATTAAKVDSSSTDRVAEVLGDVALLFNNIEIRGTRGFGDGRGGRRGGGRGFGGGGGPGGPTSDRGGAVAAAAGTGGPRGSAPSPRGSDATATPSAAGPNFTRGGPPADRTGNPRGASDPTRGGPPPPGGFRNGSPPPPTISDNDDTTRIQIDLMPIRREILREFATEEQWAKLTPDEQRRIQAEVNQRMLGIERGIHMGAAELQKVVTDAQRAAEEKAREAAVAAKPKIAAPTPKAVAPSAPAAPSAPSAAPTTAAAPVPVPAPAAIAPPAALRQRKTALSGNRLDVTVERNGEVVRQANADLDFPSLLATVFTTTRRDRGEVPFAVDKEGKLYTPTGEDRQKIEALGSDAAKPATPPGTTMASDWIVVTTLDPTGSGLKFGVARPVGDLLNELRRTTVRNAGFGLAFIGFALIGIVPLSSGLTRNLSRLNEGVHRLAHGDYRARVEVRSQDEVGRLAAAFNQMAEDVERHQAAAVGQERIRRELELGRQIQHDMLPQAPLRLGLTEIKGVSVPAREVGGDFFNYFQVANGQIALLVGDVSGKGVGAALLMANIQASLRTRLALGQDLADIAREIDVDVEGNTPGPVYATLFVGILDTVRRELRYVNAGHNPQYVLRREGTLERMVSSGLPIGLISGRGYTEARVQLAAGDVLFFYTDGCVETENEQDEMFSAERLEALLVAATGTDDILARVESEVTRFRGTREPFDDATMMAVKVG